MAGWAYRKGLHDLGSGNYGWLQPDGTWGWSNAGLIVDGDQALLVDTLFDEHLTAEMLAAMKDATGHGGGDIGTLVNTHANGDHTFGNRLVAGAEIIASAASAAEMADMPPELLDGLMNGPMAGGELGEYMRQIFGAFDFRAASLTAPGRTFSGALELTVGDKQVRLIEAGPAHTRGDILVHVPGDKTIFTGDILFIDGTPIMWAGPIGNWLKALDYILALDVETIVPGHGPITDKDGVRRLYGYLDYINSEARARFEAGLSVEEAARDIALGDYANWGDAERIVVNVDSLYREFSASTTPPDIPRLFAIMASLHRDRRQGRRWRR